MLFYREEIQAGPNGSGNQYFQMITGPGAWVNLPVDIPGLQ